MTEQEFNEKRTPIYLDIDTLIIKTANNKYSNTSHAKWFSDMGIPFVHTVRGYYMEEEDEKYLMLYWNDFEVPNINVSLFSYLFEYFPEMKWIGLGCNIGKVGEVWKPKYKIYRGEI